MLPAVVEAAPERQPLLDRQDHDSQEAAVASGSAEQPEPGPAPKSDGAAHEPAESAAAKPSMQRLPSERRCRYCLQEEPGSKLEAPCSCAGSIKWAHRDCVQRWLDEKRDKRCEICDSEFKGDYRQPPAPPPRSTRAAQPQGTIGDTPMLSLVVPFSGEEVVRMVMNSRGEPIVTAAAEGSPFSALAAAPAARGGSTRSSARAGLLVLLLVLLLNICAGVALVVILLCLAVGIGDADNLGHLLRLDLIMIALLSRSVVWAADSKDDGQPVEEQHAAGRRAGRSPADIESGLGPQRPEPGR